jgi:hypothetical protein
MGRSKRQRKRDERERQEAEREIARRIAVGEPVLVVATQKTKTRPPRLWLGRPLDVDSDFAIRLGRACLATRETCRRISAVILVELRYDQARVEAL